MSLRETAETGSFMGAYKCLSRMQGNLHVRFLGEGVVATRPPYPIVSVKTTHTQSKISDRIRQTGAVAIRRLQDRADSHPMQRG